MKDQSEPWHTKNNTLWGDETIQSSIPKIKIKLCHQRLRSKNACGSLDPRSYVLSSVPNKKNLSASPRLHDTSLPRALILALAASKRAASISFPSLPTFLSPSPAPLLPPPPTL